MNAPSMTPIQALAACRLKDNQLIDGLTYMLDGPMGSPAEFLYPIASSDEGCWYPANDAESDITEETTWVFYPY